MATAAIIGASGFSGQETFDRVLAHPELELLALGSDSLAGQGAAALDPRLGRNGHGALPAFVPNDEALASGADVVFLCLDHERAAALEPPADARRRRPLGRAPARGRRTIPRGTGSSTRPRPASTRGRTACRSCSRRRGG